MPVDSRVEGRRRQRCATRGHDHGMPAWLDGVEDLCPAIAPRPRRSAGGPAAIREVALTGLLDTYHTAKRRRAKAEAAADAQEASRDESRRMTQPSTKPGSTADEPRSAGPRRSGPSARSVATVPDLKTAVAFTAQPGRRRGRLRASGTERFGPVLFWGRRRARSRGCTPGRHVGRGRAGRGTLVGRGFALLWPGDG